MAWEEVPDEYVPKVGDILRSIICYENTGYVPANDSDVINLVEGMSNREIEDYVYEQTGVRIKVRNKKVDVVESGWKWDCTVEYEVVEAETPGIVAIAIAIAIVVGSIIAFLITVDWFVKSNEKYVKTILEDPLTRNLIMGVLLLFLLSFLISLIKR